jgi:hypothetical protein
MTLLHPHKSLIKIIMKRKMSTMIKSKRRAMIKGEMRMMGMMEKHHHIQECITMLQIFVNITRLFLLLSLSR